MNTVLSVHSLHASGLSSITKILTQNNSSSISETQTQECHRHLFFGLFITSKFFSSTPCSICMQLKCEYSRVLRAGLPKAIPVTSNARDVVDYIHAGEQFLSYCKFSLADHAYLE
jgi:hypothetical protein